MLDNVSFNQLRAFVAVCEAGSFSGGAQALSRAQSAISHAVASLEEALGVELFLRGTRKAELSPAGRSLLPDARAVIARTEEMKTRARSIAEIGAPTVSIAVDVYFPRKRLTTTLRALQERVPTAVIDLRITTMQDGEQLVMSGGCKLAVVISDVPIVDAAALERHWLAETPLITVCAPSHPLAQHSGLATTDEFSRHIQIVVTDNQPDAAKTQMEVAGERYWLVNDLSAKLDFLRAGLGWGHMPFDHVTSDLQAGRLVEVKRHAWHLHPLTFMASRRRGHEPTDCEASLIELLSQDANGRK